MLNYKSLLKKTFNYWKKHCLVFIIACLFASFLGINYNFSMINIKTKYNQLFEEEKNYILNYFQVNETAKEIFQDSINKGEERAELIKEDKKSEDKKIAFLTFGYRQGIIASFANAVASGSIYIIIYKLVIRLVSSSELYAKIAVIIAALLLMLITIFFKNVFNITYRRYFLEGVNYDNIKASTLTNIFKSKRLFNISMLVLIQDLIQSILNITIIGGIYYYLTSFCVYYISAENFDVNPIDAIKLSNQMMKGYKIKLLISFAIFIPFVILDILSLGTFGLLFLNSFFESYKVQAYVEIRENAIKNKVPGFELLNDKYLYQYPTSTQLDKVYPALDTIKYKEEENNLKGLQLFLAKNFGLIPNYEQYDSANNHAFEKYRYEIYQEIYEFKSYPSFLSPLFNKPLNKKEAYYGNYRQYSYTFVVLLFFIASFVGWVWEVSLHLVQDGVFVNRGFNYGPWLPIYGFGSVLILLLLYHFRKSMPKHFIYSFFVSGILEYIASFLMQKYSGMKWWDYTGYYLNVNGRVCLEGLLFFAFGGFCLAYFIAPAIDNFLRKFNRKILTIIAIILTIVLCIDFTYSLKYPNIGKGITDYSEVDK